MREILFKGKRVDNGEWVCGDLVRHYENQRVFILTEQLTYTTTEYGISRIVSDRYFEIIPETVSQYTGMQDRNGNKIFEGDTLKCTDELDEVNELNSDTGIGNVEWLDKYGFWNISGIENSLGDIIIFGYVEIIGNIHEEKEE